MIGYLKGKVIQNTGNGVIIGVNGVGYEVVMSGRDLNRVVMGKELEVWVYTHVREDVLALYGFGDRESKVLFGELLGVSGVGPKVGMNVMSCGNCDEIRKAIREANVEFFTSVPGIGKKGAQRIIVEMKSKVGGMEEIDFSGNPEREVAIKGLMSLGMLAKEAKESLSGVDSKMKAEKQIKEALKNG